MVFSEKQKSVVLSTTEAEFVAACSAVKELMWLKKFWEELQMCSSEKIVLKVDNQGAIRLIKNPEFHKRSKHIDVKYHFIREKFGEGMFCLEYVDTKK